LSIPSLRATRLFCLFGICGLLACKNESSARQPEWLQKVDVSVSKAQPAFDGNTEVFLALHNTSSTPLAIAHLDQPNAAVLERAGGKTSPLHRISVGVAKPIRVEPHATKTTSLLFQAGEGAPAKLNLYGKTFDVPPLARP
jgi:hypothetical protein